jgi:hypothetical protein
LLALGTCAAVVLGACGGSESDARVKNAALGKPSVVAKGSCDDGEMIEGVDDDDCVVMMKVGKSTRKASLQVLNTDGDWDTVESVVAKKGNLKIDVPATDDDGVWLDGLYTYRVFAARSGKVPEFISADFDVLYGTEFASDESTEMGGDEFGDSGAAPEMKSAMENIQQPATKFDDNCSKIFNQVDCALMFRPSKGPDFVTLGKSKWIKMCSTLLKRPESDCEKEFTFATGAAKQGAKPMPPQGLGLDPVKVVAACKAIGIAEAECRAALQAGPMAAMQKFGNKAEVFCKTYSGLSCMQMMMQMGGGMPLGGEETDGIAPPMGGEETDGVAPPMNGSNMKPPTGGNSKTPPMPGKG